MGIIVIRRMGHDLHYHSTRSIDKGARGVGKWRAIERRSCSGVEMSARECAAARCLEVKLVIGPFLLCAIPVRILNLGKRVSIGC